MCDQTPVFRNIKDDGPLNRYVKRDDVVVEHEALKKLKHKDEKALEWFIDRYAAYVNTIIYNIIGLSVSAADIEEVSSDVFFTLWVNAKNISPGKVKAYLGGVARNKAKSTHERWVQGYRLKMM